MKLSAQSIPFNIRFSLVVVTLVALVFLVFWPGSSGPWLFDDKHNIVNLYELQESTVEKNPLWQAALVNGEWQRRSFARLSFGFTVWSCGKTAWCFKVTNIVLHVLTALAIYFLLLQFVRMSEIQPGATASRVANWLALVSAGLWAVHPIQVSTVLYAVQRMTILSALFSVLALNLYCLWRRSYFNSRAKQFCAVFAMLLCCVLAYHSKENAVVLPMLVLCIELVLFYPQLSEMQKRFFGVLGAGIALTSLVAGFLLLGGASFYEPFENRSYSAWERLLTQARVLVAYLEWVFLPVTSHYTLFHDDIVASKGLLQPISTLFSTGFLVLLTGVAFFLRQYIPIVCFAWFWFLLGHAIESSFLNLELVFEHRNYLPSVGLVLGFVVVCFRLLQQQRRILFALLVSVILYCGSMTHEKSRHWRSDGSMLAYEAQFHPKSVRLNYKAGFLWLQLSQSSQIDTVQQQAYLRLAEQSMLLAANANEWSIHGFVGLLYLQSQGVVVERAGLWAELYHRLQYSPLSADVANLLGLLTHCYLQRQCDFEQKQLALAYEHYLSRNMKATSRVNAERDLRRLLAAPALANPLTNP